MFLSDNTRTLHRFWWLWLPFIILIGVAVANPFLDDQGNAWMYAENGLLETLQWVIALAAAFVGIVCLRYCREDRLLVPWVLLAVAGSLYIGLEEISYGQHLLGWETPEYWQNLNDQGETNLHNTSSWFDQKPRLLLLFGVIGGGVLVPLLRRFRPGLLPARYAVIYPVDVMFWTALCALLSHVANWSEKLGVIIIYNRSSEVNEVFLYYFVLLYLIYLLHSLRRSNSAR